MQILAIDAGGTSTRAVIVDSSGRCLGYGRSGPGNPTSSGPATALASVVQATSAARAAAGPGTLSSAAVTMAGFLPGTAADLTGALRPLGLAGELFLVGDVLSAYFSGTYLQQGYALVVGTGTIAARIEGSAVARLGDGTGWLLGDSGSGYWIGHRVARAVAADLDGSGTGTALTGPVLEALGVTRTAGLGPNGRPRTLQDLIHAVYQLRPVELSRLAPLAFDAAADPVAAGILGGAATAIASCLESVRLPGVPGPVVLGGGVLSSGMLAATADWAEPLHRALQGTQALPVRDGVAGAAVLGLLRAGAPVDAEVFARVGEGTAHLQDRLRNPQPAPGIIY